ncbi:MAG: hypothetical protein PHC54_06315 [Candidatus Omnitrophica bacterium]|nr:hypothetical protein [Candidatus Omnitrophota bacterium]MDD5592868.1 hypothetical protein [Candidatus Omnitrophota bacterium]
MICLRKKTAICLFIGVFIFLLSEAGSVEEKKEPAKKIEYKAEKLKDPFQEENIGAEGGAEAAQKPLPALAIQGMVWGGTFPQAIINAKVVKIGDTIAGARIIDISKSGVTVLYEDKKYNLGAPLATAQDNSQKKQ